jgi:hypothetical protein
MAVPPNRGGTTVIRTLLLTAAVGLGLAATTPALAEAPHCISGGLECQGYTCPPGYKTIVNSGFADTGPWVVICQPKP